MAVTTGLNFLGRLPSVPVTKIDSNFIPELWSQKLMDSFTQSINIKQRSYGERLLRAAAKGEDWTKIKRKENINERFTSDAADALAYAIDRNVLNSLRGPGPRR